MDTFKASTKLHKARDLIDQASLELGRLELENRRVIDLEIVLKFASKAVNVHEDGDNIDLVMAALHVAVDSVTD